MKITKTMRIRMVAAILALIGSAAAAHANDGVYYVNGSHLEPLQETDIAIKKELLTITIGDDGLAYVEVDYEFMNNGNAKDVTMGFEARPPYNDDSDFNTKGVHPHIMDFNVVMNGMALSHRNGLVFVEGLEGEMPEEAQKAKENGQKFIPVDSKRWKVDNEMGQQLYNSQTDEFAYYAYAYYFDAHFNKGLNTVRHTYKYRMSFSVESPFEITYWLLPAMRWANKRIDDFTLRIKTDKCTKHFIIDNQPFGSTPFRVTKGKGKTRVLNTIDGDGYTITEVVLRDGTLEWHRNNFVTDHDLDISSAHQIEYLVDWGNAPIPVYYDSSDTYIGFMATTGDFIKYFPKEGSEKQAEAFAKRVMRNLPYAHRGYVFKDAKLRKYFESQWWYMPDPKWKPTENSFSEHEHDLLNELK